MLAGYLLVFGIVAISAAVSFTIGGGEHSAPSVIGTYASAAPCLGKFELNQSGTFVDLSAGATGKLRLHGHRLTGDVNCRNGGRRRLQLDVSTVGKTRRLLGTVDAEQVSATQVLSAKATAARTQTPRSPEETVGRLMLAIAIVILAARAVGVLSSHLSQPRVMGEVIAGILLGPTLLGAVWQSGERYVFPADIVPLLSAAAQIGLVFYLFLVGLEFDPALLRNRVKQAAFISNTSVAIPMSLGLLLAIPLYPRLAPDVRYAPFALFVGVAMSITAFPVLARILIERRMLRHPIGALALAGAAIDDVTAWFLLALATAVAGAGSGVKALEIVGWAAVFTLAMATVVRRFLARAGTAYSEVGELPLTWTGAIFVTVLLSAYTAQQIGIAAVFGAFITGAVMPRSAGLTTAVSRRIDDFVLIILLPLFFVVTGLKVKIGALDRPELWLLTAGIIAVAVAGKWLGAAAAARYARLGFRDSMVLGALMNTRGLTELIVLNIGAEIGVISPTLFTMLVVMALVTTFMTGPALAVLDRHRELTVEPEAELAADSASPPPAVLVAAQDGQNLGALLALAKPIGRTEPRRELILVEVHRPGSLVGGTLRDQEAMSTANARLDRQRQILLSEGFAARAAVFISTHPGEDYVRLAAAENVDLLLIDGRRPFLGNAVPRGAVGKVLEKAPCDVAVLVERKDAPPIDDAHPVALPFGGAEHDWAALELAALIASARGARLRLIAPAPNGDVNLASRVVGKASLVVQSFTGMPVETRVIEPGGKGIVQATSDAGLLVIGLSSRWRESGLGPVRGAIARDAAPPILFVRRGSGKGLLAPDGSNLTRFSWSSAGVDTPGPPE